MSLPVPVAEALRILGARDSWRVDALPSEVNEAILRILDNHGFIEFRLWEHTPGGPPCPMQYCDIWFSPLRKPNTAGPLAGILEKYSAPDVSPEVRITELGKATIAELALAESPAAPTPQAPTVPTATLAKAFLFEQPDILAVDLAKKIGVSPGTLYKKTGAWKDVRKLLMARGDKPGAHGFKDANGNVEAWDEDEPEGGDD